MSEQSACGVKENESRVSKKLAWIVVRIKYCYIFLKTCRENMHKYAIELYLGGNEYVLFNVRREKC
jgi:hypothetical protein